MIIYKQIKRHCHHNVHHHHHCHDQPPDDKVDVEAWNATRQLWETRNSLEISKDIGNKKQANTPEKSRNSLEMSKYCKTLEIQMTLSQIQLVGFISWSK